MYMGVKDSFCIIIMLFNLAKFNFRLKDASPSLFDKHLHTHEKCASLLLHKNKDQKHG